jgi:vacuolar-type H+-ATPase subunit E/Vma4
MALEDLIRTRRRDAEQEAAAIQAAAQAEADAIRTRTDQDLAARRGSVLAEREAERRSAVELALSAARHEARRGVLEARARLLDRVFTAARDRFPAAVSAPEYRDILSRWLAEAIGCLAGRSGTLRGHPALREDLARLAAGRTGITLVDDPGVGSGFRLVSDDGAVEIDATLEDRLTRLEQRLRQEVLAALEPPP